MVDEEARQGRLKKLIASGFSRRYVLVFVLLILYIAFTAFTTESLSIFNGEVSNMNDLEFYLMASASLLLGAGIIIFAFKSFNAKFNRPLFVICAVLLVIDIVAVSTFPETISANWMTYTIHNNERIRYIFNWLVADVGIYIFIGIVPYIFKSHTGVDFWLWVGIFVGVLLTVASLITEQEAWKSMFSGGNFEGLKSLTNNKNTFGFAILWSFNCSLILYAKYHKPYFLAFCIFFVLMTVATVCKTSIATLGIEVLLTMIVFPIISWKKRKKGQIIFLSIMAVCIAIVLLIAYVPIEPLKGLSKLLKDELNLIFHLSGGTMTGRTDIWKGIFAGFKAKPTVLLFGAGDSVFEYFVGVYAADGMTAKLAAHNGFLYVWGRLGIVGLLVYVFFIGYIIYNVIRAIKVRKETWMAVLFIVLFGFLCHSMAEDDALLDMRLKGMMFLGIIWWPIGVSNRDYKLSICKEAQKEKVKITTLEKITSLDVLKTSYMISMVLFVVFVGLAPLFETAFGSCLFNNKYSLSGLTVLFLVGPLLFYEAKELKDSGNKICFIMHTILSAFVVVIGVVVGATINSLSYPIAMTFVLLFVLTEGAIGAKFQKLSIKDVYPLLIKVFVAVLVVGLSHCLNAGLPAETMKTCLVAMLCLYVSLEMLVLSIFPKEKFYNGAAGFLEANFESKHETFADRIEIEVNERMNSTY